MFGLHLVRYGCDRYNYYDWWYHEVQASTQPCRQSLGYGWMTVLYFILLTVFGGYVMPSLIVAIVAGQCKRTFHYVSFLC